jgi:hypothetical protein
MKARTKGSQGRASGIWFGSTSTRGAKITVDNRCAVEALASVHRAVSAARRQPGRPPSSLGCQAERSLSTERYGCDGANWRSPITPLERLRLGCNGCIDLP